MCNFETWRDVVGFEGLYMVSNLGHVRRGKKPVNLRPGRASGGVRFVALSRNGKSKAIPVHKLVMEAFVEPTNGRVITHVDGDQDNCRLDNLRFISKEDALKARVEAAVNANRTPVDQYLFGVYKATYESMAEAERQTGINQGAISNACRGVIKTAGGYTWKYAEAPK